MFHTHTHIKHDEIFENVTVRMMWTGIENNNNNL